MNPGELSEGDIVRGWFDSGGKNGANMVWGIVTSTGVKTFSVLWESGLRNRLKYAETKGVEREHNHGAVAVTRQVMRERGLISPDGKPCKTVLP